MIANFGNYTVPVEAVNIKGKEKRKGREGKRRREGGEREKEEGSNDTAWSQQQWLVAKIIRLKVRGRDRL